MTGDAGSAHPAAARRTRLAAGLAAATGAGLSFVVLPWPAAGFAALLAVIAMAIVVADIEFRVIPDAANLALFVLGIAFALTDAGLADAVPVGIDALLRSVAAGGSLYILRFAYHRFTGTTGLGLGDVKLAAAGAPFLAWATLPLALVLAALAGMLAALATAASGRAALNRTMEVPFGACLAPAIWLALVLERNGLFQI